MRTSSTAKRDGFTLVELMVVIFIIAILVGMLVPAILMAKHLAAEKVCSSNLRSANLGMIIYAYGNNDYYLLEPTEHNPHPNLVQALVSGAYATEDIFYCPQAFFMEAGAQNSSLMPVGATDSVINTPENLQAGNISYVYWSFQENKKFGSQTWRNTAYFLPRQLMLDRAVPIDPAQPCRDATPSERWVMSDFFRRGAPFPHARRHAKGLNVVFQDSHTSLIYGKPKNIYR